MGTVIKAAVHFARLNIVFKLEQTFLNSVQVTDQNGSFSIQVNTSSVSVILDNRLNRLNFFFWLLTSCQVSNETDEEYGQF